MLASVQIGLSLMELYREDFPVYAQNRVLALLYREQIPVCGQAGLYAWCYLECTGNRLIRTGKNVNKTLTNC